MQTIRPTKVKRVVYWLTDFLKAAIVDLLRIAK
jgi:hypothetical protein